MQEANILRVSLIIRLARTARSRFAGQRLPYHQNARTRRARGDRGKCRTNSSLRENCHCSIGAKSRNWRKNLQSRKVKNTRHLRYSVRGGGCSPHRTGLIQVKFPDNRENTGNFARFGPVNLILRAQSVSSSKDLPAKFPCNGTGNFLRETGKRNME